MKRSNRLVLLVGVFLAIVAFVGVLLLSNQTPSSSAPPTELPTVVAATDIPLGTRITADQVTIATKAVAGRDPDAFGDVSQVIGKIVREPVTAGAAITAKTLTGGAQGQVLDISCPATFRCMSVQVDQVTGVGTIIKAGDYVDMVTGVTGTDKIPLVVSPTARPGGGGGRRVPRTCMACRRSLTLVPLMPLTTVNEESFGLRVMTGNLSAVKPTTMST